MRSVLSSDGNSRTWRAGFPARAVGKVADHRTAPERASSARRPMSVWTTIMSGPACKTSSAVASEAARTRPCIRPPSPLFFGSVCSNSPSFTQRCSPVTRSYSATTAGPFARRPCTNSVPLCGSTRRVTIWVSPGRRESRSEEHTSELQSLAYLVCRLLLEKKKKNNNIDSQTMWQDRHQDKSSIDRMHSRTKYALVGCTRSVLRHSYSPASRLDRHYGTTDQ